MKIKNSEYISTTEAARILGMSEKTIIRYIKDRKILAIKPGKNYKISRESFERFLKGFTV